MEGAVLSGKLAAKEINEMSRAMKLAENAEINKEVVDIQKAIVPELVIA